MQTQPTATAEAPVNHTPRLSVRLVPAGVDPRTVAPTLCTPAEIVAHLNATCGREDQVAPGVYRTLHPELGEVLHGEVLDYVSHIYAQDATLHIRDGQPFVSDVASDSPANVITGFLGDWDGQMEVFADPDLAGPAPYVLASSVGGVALVEPEGEVDPGQWTQVYGNPECTGNSVVAFYLSRYFWEGLAWERQQAQAN